MTYLILAALLVLLTWRFFQPSKRATVAYRIPVERIRDILIDKVQFYEDLPTAERLSFEDQVVTFLARYKITGVETNITDTDRVLVAASGIIPIFRFPDWTYRNLREILIYPQMFNHDFETTGADRNILGMVGEGYMKNTMVLSQKALHLGFSNETDKKNTAIHEFVHLIDMMDGRTDGVPSLLLERPYVLPWIDLMEKKIDEIYQQQSDINPYGGTNKAEFFAVASEYFFERPMLLKKKHPKLFELLQQVFGLESKGRG